MVPGSHVTSSEPASMRPVHRYVALADSSALVRHDKSPTETPFCEGGVGPGRGGAAKANPVSVAEAGSIYAGDGYVTGRGRPVALASVNCVPNRTPPELGESGQSLSERTESLSKCQRGPSTRI